MLVCRMKRWKNHNTSKHAMGQHWFRSGRGRDWMTQQAFSIPIFYCLQFHFVFEADAKKQNQSGVSGIGLSSQPLARPLQPLQATPLQQTGVPTSGPSQTTIHVLPTGNFILYSSVNVASGF